VRGSKEELSMKCPVCHVELKIADRQGVEIDYCPQCRGVWLDRGELDKMIERATAVSFEEPRDDDERYGYSERYGYTRRRRKSWFGELFDFD
jgi:uncharacterized protein